MGHRLRLSIPSIGQIEKNEKCFFFLFLHFKLITTGKFRHGSSGRNGEQHTGILNIRRIEPPEQEMGRKVSLS